MIRTYTMLAICIVCGAVLAQTYDAPSKLTIKQRFLEANRERLAHPPPQDVLQMPITLITNSYPEVAADDVAWLRWSLTNSYPALRYPYYELSFLRKGDRRTNAAPHIGEGWYEINCMGYGFLMTTNGQAMPGRRADGSTNAVSYGVVQVWNENPHIEGRYDLNPEATWEARP